MMPKVDLVITDVDGTLVLPEQHNPSAAVRKAVADVQLAGITLAAATGRPYEMAKNLFLDVGLKDECIFDNGATIRNAQTGKIVWQNWLEVSRLKEIYKLVSPHALRLDFSPEWNEVAADTVTLKDIRAEAPYFFTIVRASVASQIVGQLKAMGGFNIWDWQLEENSELWGIQVTDQNSNKFHAVNSLKKLVHTDKKHTLAIGDHSNDLALFQAADIKIAMGNAVDELKAAADYVVAPVERDGFAEAMHKFVLVD